MKRVDVHQNKRKKKRTIGIWLSVITIVLGFFLYKIAENKITVQNQLIEELTQKSDELFTDSKYEDIPEDLTINQVKDVKEEADQENIWLTSKNRDRHSEITQRITLAEKMVVIQEKVSDLDDDEEIDEIETEEIDTLQEELAKLKQETPLFYQRNTDFLEEYKQEFLAKKEAKIAIDALYDGDSIREDITLDEEREATKAVAELEDSQLKEELLASLKQVKKKTKAERKVVALTFDDGPGGEPTERILDTLDEYDVKATFFMLSKNVEAMPELAKKVADEGHEIANHSISHPDLARLSTDEINKEIKDSAKSIEKATGQYPTLFRPPYGSFNDKAQTAMNESGQSNILWDVDTLDWQSHDKDAILNIVKNTTHSGSIILMHDIHDTSADAVPSILKYLQDKNFEFATVSELMELNNIDPETVVTNF